MAEFYICDAFNEQDSIKFCKNCVNEMLGRGSLDNPSITYIANDPTTNPDFNILFFYKNWSNIEKVDSFLDNLAQYDDVTKTDNTNTPSTNLYDLGTEVLTIYFGNIFNNTIPSLSNTLDQPLLESLYRFAVNDGSLGIFSEYLKNTLCKNISSGDLPYNINYKKWCGCYLQEYTNTVNEINKMRLDYIQENTLNLSGNENWLFGNQCMPYCADAEAIKIYYRNNNKETIFTQVDNDPTVNQLMFEPVQCVATVCIIDKNSYNITSSSAKINIKQLCKCTELNNCICIIDKDVDENGLAKIKPGLDNPVNIKQSCGNGSLCADIDAKGNILSLEVCKKDGKGNPDPFIPDSTNPENGKFNPTNVNSIQNISFGNIWFIILLVFFVCSFLYFLAARNLKKHFTNVNKQNLKEEITDITKLIKNGN